MPPPWYMPPGDAAQLARAVQVGDGAALGIQHLCILIAAGTSLGVEHIVVELHCIVGAVVKSGHGFGAAAKGIVHTSLRKIVEVPDSLRQAVHTCGFGQSFDGTGAHHGLQVGLGDGVCLQEFFILCLVKYHIGDLGVDGMCQEPPR